MVLQMLPVLGLGLGWALLGKQFKKSNLLNCNLILLN
jgi:hypothetical protein